jgi:hypothetical protein
MNDKTTFGDGPIEQAYRDKMNALAASLDKVFNGEAKGKDRKVGFVLMVFPFTDDGHTDGHDCNYISNANRPDIVTLMKEMVARFEGQPEMKGRA